MVDEISALELKQRLDRGEDVQVIDIRSADQFRAGHIPGAENVPYDEFTLAIEEYDWGDDIVVACPIGESSQRACMLLSAYEGVDTEQGSVANLTGGYEEWPFALESGDGDGESE